jgi:hypothetical protein
MPESKLLMTQVWADRDTPSFPMKGSVEISASTSTAQSTALTGNIVMAYCATACYIAWGVNPTATLGAGDGKTFCPASEWTEVHINDGDKIAVILASGTDTMYVRYPKVQPVG